MIRLSYYLFFFSFPSSSSILQTYIIKAAPPEWDPNDGRREVGR